jgi:hypothetical protein
MQWQNVGYQQKFNESLLINGVYLRFSIDSDLGRDVGELAAELRRLGGDAVDAEDAVGEEGA